MSKSRSAAGVFGFFCVEFVGFSIEKFKKLQKNKLLHIKKGMCSFFLLLLFYFTTKLMRWMNVFVGQFESNFLRVFFK